MTRFSLDWLGRREPVDGAARDPGLGRRFAASLPRAPGRVPRLLDLGAGSGANFRALAPVIAGDQEWLLLDHDRELLAAQKDVLAAWALREGHAAEVAGDCVAMAAGTGRWRARTLRCDLARELDRLDMLACDGVTAAALIDLVSAAWIEALAERLARRRLPLLAVLGVDGRRDWSPSMPEDQVVGEAFAAHQHRDKGFGPALGGAAPACLAQQLGRRGFRIATAASDWRLGPAQDGLLGELIAGEAEAARAARPAAAAAIAAWERRRCAELAAGRLSLVIGHRDVLALPPG